jgi:hypothetical protein
MTTDNEHTYSPGERAILREVRCLRKEITQMGTEEQVALEGLETQVTELQGDETEAAAKFTALAEEIKGLEAGTVTAAQINELAKKAEEVGTELKAATASA